MYRIATVEDAEKYMELAFKSQVAPHLIRAIDVYISIAEKLANKDSAAIVPTCNRTKNIGTQQPIMLMVISLTAIAMASTRTQAQ